MVFKHPIDNRDRFFKGQHSDENFVCFFRHHWIVLLKQFIYFIAFGLFCVVTMMAMSKIQDIIREDRALKILFLTGYMALTFFMHRIFIKMLNYFTNIGIITDMRVIIHKKSIFFIDDMDSIDMSQIQNIETIKTGLLPSLLRYGSIKIFLNASDAITTLYLIPNPKFHFRCISRQKEISQQRRQHQSIKEVKTHTYSSPSEPFKTLSN